LFGCIYINTETQEVLMVTTDNFFGFSRENFVDFFKMPLPDIFWGIAITIFFFCCWVFDWLLIQLHLRKDKPYIN